MTNKNGAIVIIEDDADDRELLTEAFKSLDFANKIVFFEDGEKALEHLKSGASKPFLILSDINLPKLNGFQLRDKLHTDGKLNLKCIPYLFFTTSASQATVIEAYSKSSQGFFVKPATFEKLKTTLKKIVEYWQECEAPAYV